MGRDTGCILRVAKCDTGSKRSDSRVREEDSQVQQSLIQLSSAQWPWRQTLGALADDAHVFLAEIGRTAMLCTADRRETTFLYQRISVAIQRFNAACLANLLTVSESPS